MPRKLHAPTRTSKAEVRALAQFGVIESEIAKYIGIDAKTLRKHYREELDKAHIKANVKVANSLFTCATKKENVSAQIFWLKVRAGWSEKHQEDILLERKLKKLQIEKAIQELEIMKQSPKDRSTVADLLTAIIENMPD